MGMEEKRKLKIVGILLVHGGYCSHTTTAADGEISRGVEDVGALIASWESWFDRFMEITERDGLVTP